MFVGSDFKFPHFCENLKNERPSHFYINVMQLPNGKECLFTDTVGFIQKLPTQLVSLFEPCFELCLPLMVEHFHYHMVDIFDYF